MWKTRTPGKVMLTDRQMTHLVACPKKEVSANKQNLGATATPNSVQVRPRQALARLANRLIYSAILSAKHAGQVNVLQFPHHAMCRKVSSQSAHVVGPESGQEEVAAGRRHSPCLHEIPRRRQRCRWCERVGVTVGGVVPTMVADVVDVSHARSTYLLLIRSRRVPRHGSTKGTGFREGKKTNTWDVFVLWKGRKQESRLQILDCNMLKLREGWSHESGVSKHETT